ncbi:MAG TPA: DUF6127 family protein, partial [Armatimonadota bacterium]|nr:DUF6127 family protein [Armatimonadota bacterium]
MRHLKERGGCCARPTTTFIFPRIRSFALWRDGQVDDRAPCAGGVLHLHVQKAEGLGGLDGEDAAHDIRELRNLLDAFNEAKKTAGLTIIKMVVTGLVMAILTGT